MLARSTAPAPDLAEWLGDLYTAHFAAVFRVCRTLLWNREDAADATHDVFARAARLDGPFGTDEHSRAWLLAVARNRCIDMLRRRARLDQALARSGMGTEPFADPEGVTLDRHMVQQVLVQLSPRERRLLWLSAVEHRSLREIAAGLRLTQVAAGQALHRARRRAGAIAARIASVIGLIRFRRAGGGTPSVRDALPFALVPLLAVSMHSSIAAMPAPSHLPALVGAPSTAEPGPGPLRFSVGLPPSRSSSPIPQSVPPSAAIPGAAAASEAAALVQNATSLDPLRTTSPARVIAAGVEKTLLSGDLSTSLGPPTVHAPQ